MIPLAEIQKTHKKAKYLQRGTNNSGKSTIILAEATDTDGNWYSLENERMGFKLVPQALIEEAVELIKPSMENGYLEDYRRVSQARKKVIVCQIVSVIEAAPFIIKPNTIGYKKTMVVFEDMLVLEPVSPKYKGLQIYVAERHAGLTKKNNLNRMIGSLVPVKINELRERKYPDYNLNQIKVKSNYVAEGNIEIAEKIMNKELVDIFNEKMKDIDTGDILEKESLKKEKDKLLNKVFDGIISSIDSRGIYVVTREGYLFRLKANDCNYYAKSKVIDFRDSVQLLEQVSFKLKDAKFNKLSGKKSTDNEVEEYRLWGDHICLEQSPTDIICDLIDNKRLVGKVFNAYITTYDANKGHFVEFEGYPGIRFKLDHDNRLESSLVFSKTKISVVVYRARYVTKENNKKIMTVHCHFNTVVGNINSSELSSFFD